MKCAELYPPQLDTWLDDILSSLEHKTRSVIRRSGGLPYLIVNVLKAEKDRINATLDKVFTKLLKISRLPVSDSPENQEIPQVNAFNCIRAIFADSSLAEFCSPFISPALNLALDNFRSEKWPIRNCSLMLFTALQNRIFNRAGKGITDRILFSKYDGLEKKLLDILGQCNRTSEDSPQISFEGDKRSIFLVLSILSQLKSLSKSDKLLNFKYEVQKCLGNKVWKIREMAAKTYSCLSNSPIYDGVELLTGCSTSNENRLHGNLLALRYMLDSGSFKNYDSDSKYFVTLRDLLFGIGKNLLLNNMCYVTCSEYLNVLDRFLSLYGGTFDPELLKILGSSFLHHHSVHGMDGTKQLFISKLLRLLFKLESEENCITLFQLGLETDLHEVQLVALEFGVDDLNHSLLQSPDRYDTETRVESLLFDSDSLPIVKSLCVKLLQRLQAGLSFEKLMDIIRNEASGRTLLLTTIEALGGYVSREEINLFLRTIETFADDSADRDYRAAAAKSLMDCTDRYLDISVMLKLHKLLYDDDEGVRKLVAGYINKSLLKRPDWDVNCNVLKTSHLLLKQFTQLFSASDISEKLTKEMVNYLGGLDEFKIKGEDRSETLFEMEKDNQYRNDMEVYLSYIQLLGDAEIDSISEIREFTKNLCNELRSYIMGEDTRDSILGWLTDLDIFMRIVVLRKLVEFLTPDTMPEFSELLQEAHAHPLAFQYDLIGI